VPSRDKNVKKKPTAKPRGGLYKPGEEIKPQSRGSIFKGYPEVKRQDLKNRSDAGKRSAGRRDMRKHGFEKEASRFKDARASWLYDEKSMDKYLIGKDSSIPKELKAKTVKKLNKDMNRLTRVMSEDAEYMARASNKASRIHEAINNEKVKPSRVKSAAQRIKSLLKGGYIAPKSSRSKMYSPAGALIELGVQGYKPDKSTKKIKKLKKQAVST